MPSCDCLANNFAKNFFSVGSDFRSKKLEGHEIEAVRVNRTSLFSFPKPLVRTEPTEIEDRDLRERRRELVSLLATAIARSKRTRTQSEENGDESHHARLNSADTHRSL